MNPVVLYFASGESLYPGAAILLVAIAISPLLERRWLLRFRNVSAWLALIMIVMACSPLSWAVDVVFLFAYVFWYFAANLSALRKARGPTSAILAILLIILPGFELQHRSLPQVTGAPADHVVVIGDSISAGIDPRVPPWPVVMEETLGVPVKNLSSAGAFTADGLRMAAQVAPEDQVILIEIGGNDLIASEPSSEFAGSLEAILKKVTAPGRTVVMFELPLLPDRIGYGKVQRQLAKKYGVWLIPKRYFVGVIGGANATSDGLHLLPEGTRRMADLVAQILAPILKRGPPPPKAEAQSLKPEA